MRKEQRTALVEFVSTLPDDALKWMGIRLIERRSGDIPLVLQDFEQRPDVDAVLASAGSGEEIFAILGVIQDLIAKEAKRRGMTITMRPLQPTE